jgi:hypothetical protein
MKDTVSTDSRTTLSDETYERCLSATVEYLKTVPFIRNRDLRAITRIEYDQAITFFNRALEEELLQRRGKASGTHYVLNEKSLSRGGK